ncbi:hypothetical protein LXL04_020068 [Taraxacum kok-saghyz]
MDSMDVKGIAWVGNIYQKFEAMCLEVEEAMCQETAKYVENQVQTMGAGMKRFCSDVMQDLLPPSSKDLSRVASAELLLNPYLEFGVHMKPISTFKEDVEDKKGISEGKNGISCEDKSNCSNDAWEDWSAASLNWEVSDKDEAKCDHVSNEDTEWETRGGQEGQLCNLIVGTSPAPTITNITNIGKSSVNGGKRSRGISSRNIIKAEIKATSEASQMVSQTCSNTSSEGDISRSDPCENSSDASLTRTNLHDSDNTECAQSVGDEVFLSHTGSSADCDPVSKKENNTTEAVGDESKSAFEETCVLVDGNDYHHPIKPKQETRKSYKKKIQGAFSLKNNSSRKQEYKQLVTQYDNNITYAINKKTDKLVACDLIESEWEIL